MPSDLPPDVRRVPMAPPADIVDCPHGVRVWRCAECRGPSYQKPKPSRRRWVWVGDDLESRTAEGNDA